MPSASVVIVGGGHNGLVCSYYLARAGFDVTLLERRPIVGGAAVTEEFHPGFRNSTASYTVSLLHPSVINDLNLSEHGLRILERRINNYLPFADGSSLTCHSNLDDMQAEVRRFSIHDAEQLPRYYADLDAVVPVVKDIMLMTPPRLESSLGSDLGSLFQLSRKFSSLDGGQKRLLLKLFSISAEELLDEYFESDAVKAWLGFDSIVGHYASPASPGTAYVLLHHVLGEVNGKSGIWGHAVGGMGAITTAMRKACESVGVRIRVNTPTTAIHVKNQRANSVVTEDGEIIPADLVVSGVNPKVLFLHLLPAEVLAAETVAHFENYKCKSGTFRMNVALDALPEFTAEKNEHYLSGGVIMAPSLAYMDKAYTDARSHGWSAEPIVEMLVPSIVDSTLAPKGKHVASLFCQQFDPGLAGRWDQHRFDAAATIIDTVTQYAPNFRESILATQIHSPWDLERKFGLIGGDISHGRLSLDQLFSARPMLGAGNYRTEIDNVWMCGAGTHPGGGVSGLPGRNAAREIIRKA